MTSYLPRAQVARHLDLIRELATSVQLTDMHVHATEVIRARQRYIGDAADLLSETNAPAYTPAVFGPLRLSVPDAVSRMDPQARNRLSEMMFERTFQHTGVRVIHDQMDLCGISRALLLPVASVAAPINEQMTVLSAMQKASKRLLIGYSIPSEVPADRIREHLRSAASRYMISAVKLHPNLTGIDLDTENGINRVEATLEASGELKLPVIVHGGCSPILGDSPSARYSSVDALARIDWSITDSAVVIAHFGVYGCGGQDAHHLDLKPVNRLLEKHSNVYLDTSGVGPNIIEAVMPQADVDRLVFGSDALYLPMWQVLAAICHSIGDQGHSRLCDALTRMAGRNAETILGLGDLQ